MTITRRELMAASAGLATYWPAPTLSLSFAQDQSKLSEQTLINDLLAANHFLADQQVVDGYGHVSVRDPNNTNRYLLARGVAPALVTAPDILTFDLDSNALNANGVGLYSERFIHGEIYKARPDVKAVVHAHAAALIPFGVMEIPLRPISHQGAFIGTGVPIFEIREVREPGNKSMLISTPALGKALARTLADHAAVLLRGHGAAIVGSGLGQAVARSVYLQRNAMIQAQAMSLGSKINYMDADEARAMGNGTYDRDWDYWRKQWVTGRCG